MSNYRFKQVLLRAWHKEKKKMFYSSDEGSVIAVGKHGFAILHADICEEDNDKAILMSGTGYRDKDNNEIYEGDVLFMRRPTKKGLFPIIGVVQGRDFTFSVFQGKIHYAFDYIDKDVQVLGNVFEHSDEELASKGEELLKKYELK